MVRAGALTVAAPFAVAASLIVTDAIKKYRRDAAEVSFPHLPPLDGEVAGTRTRLFTYGEDLYASMLAAIRGAQHTIMLESYIWKGDAIGAEFKEALIEAADRGVSVYVIFDGFANLADRVGDRFARLANDQRIERLAPRLHQIGHPR